MTPEFFRLWHVYETVCVCVCASVCVFDIRASIVFLYVRMKCNISSSDTISNVQNENDIKQKLFLIECIGVTFRFDSIRLDSISKMMQLRAVSTLTIFVAGIVGELKLVYEPKNTSLKILLSSVIYRNVLCLLVVFGFNAAAQ